MQILIKLLPIYFRDRFRPTWHLFSLEAGIFFGKLKRQLTRPPFPETDNGTINLHLGCGDIYHPKFINIDGLPAAHVHFVRSINDLSPFQSNSVNLIYASHCLEHFSHREVSRVLAEWFRVLKKGGSLRLSIPDFDVLVAIYQDSGNDINTIQPVLMGGQDYKFNFHMVAFNRSSLTNLLIGVGFEEVKEWSPGCDELAILNDTSSFQISANNKRYSVSLNLEAIK